MRFTSHTESIRLAVGGEMVRLSFEAGSTVDVPRNLVAKNSLLYTNVTEATPGETTTLTVVRGALQEWVKSIEHEPFVKWM